MKTFLSFVCLFFSSVAFAAPTIKQVNGKTDQIAVTTTRETTVGSQWVANMKTGGQCVFEVVQQSNSVTLMEADDCNMAQLRVGQKLEKSLFTAGQTQGSAKGGPAWLSKLKGFSIIGFYSTADELPYKAGNVSGTVSAENSFGFGAEYNYSLTRATQGLPLAVVGGLTYEMAREWDSFSERGVTTNYVGNKPTLSIWTPYLNAQYNMGESFGVFAGMNYSIPRLSDSGTLKMKSDLGYQMGASLSFTESIAADAIYRWLNFGANSNISDVSLDGFTIRGRYIF